MSVPILVNMLIETLRNGESPARTRAKESLVSYGASAVEPLIAVLQTGTSRQIADAIIILGKIGDPRAIEPLIAMLNAPNLLFRMNAAQALGGFNSPVVVEVLLSSLKPDEESEAVQSWALNSLGKIGEKNAVEPLIAHLKQTPSTLLRYMIIKALGELNDPRAIDTIIPFLTDENHHVRSYAQEALASLGYADAEARGGSR